MKRVTAFILLLCHMNTSMFLPQVAEVDVFDTNGRQADDINTVGEYIVKVIFSKVDKTNDDEDDDSGQNFHMAKTIQYQCPQLVITELEKPSINQVKDRQLLQNAEKIPSVYFDILTPPPRI